MKDIIFYYFLQQLNLQEIIRRTPSIVLSLFGYKLYTIRTGVLISTLLRRMNVFSTDLEDDVPSGYFIGNNFVGWTDFSPVRMHYSQTMIIFAHESTYKNMMEILNKVPSVGLPIENSKKITDIGPGRISFAYSQVGCSRVYVKNRLSAFTARPNQLAVINDILDIFNARGHACVYIHGDPGVGKSTIADLIAQFLHGCLVNRTLDLLCSEKNDLTYHHSCIVEDKNYPAMVVAIDEVDIILDAVLAGQKPLASGKKRPVESKADWNAFLDDIDKGMYDSTIVIMTSNKTPETYHQVDASMLRTGRVDAFFHMSK